MTIPKPSWLLGYTTVDNCAKYVEISAFSDPYFPVYGQNHILPIKSCPHTGEYGLKRKPVFWHISRNE